MWVGGLAYSVLGLVFGHRHNDLLFIYLKSYLICTDSYLYDGNDHFASIKYFFFIYSSIYIWNKSIHSAALSWYVSQHGCRLLCLGLRHWQRMVLTIIIAL